MDLVSAVALLAAAAVFGGALLALFALIRAAFWRFRPAPLLANRGELWAVNASLVAAVLGSCWLLFGPAYSGAIHSASLSSSGAISESVTHTTETFVEANGTGVIPLLTLPVLFTLLPFAFWRFRPRPIVEACCALLLGGQAAVGMSGYGLFFAPSGFIMLIAGVLASRSNAA